MSDSQGAGEHPLESMFRDFYQARKRYLFSLLRVGARVPLGSGEKVTVIILSYKRMANIQRILTSVLLCGFVERVIVSNNNPEVDLSRFIAHRDPRLEIVQHKEHKGPSYRYDIARDCDSEYFICIDDDIFPTPWQLRRLFMSLLRVPERPVGSSGDIYDEQLGEWRRVESSTMFPGKQTSAVDVILHIYAFNRQHLQRYFDNVSALGLRNEDIHSSEDVIISFTGREPPVFVDAGYIPMCPTSMDPAVATYQRDGFDDYRVDLYRKMLELRKSRRSIDDGRSPESSGDAPVQSRGCVFFNFGNRCALRLLVAVFSLRRFYRGPVTVFLVSDQSSAALAPDLEQLQCDVVFIDSASKSNDKHRMFEMSPYTTTLVFDSDLLFLSPIDELWSHVEREGVLATRFYPNPYGIDGSPHQPGWADRVKLLAGVRELVDAETYKAAFHRLVDERIDVNVGVLGITSPGGNGFLGDWSERMESARGRRILLLDEMLGFALLANHRHYLAEEIWNCPADEFFRRTNLADARIIHYFADGTRVRGMRLGRNRNTWAGKKWYDMYQLAAEQLELRRWTECDPHFEFE